MSARLGLAGVLVAACAAASAADAVAATTFGSTATPTSTCSVTRETLTINSGAPPAPQYASPVDGVITSWTWTAGTTVPEALRLKVLRGALPNLTTVAHAGAETLLVPSQANTFPARVPIRTGDRIGVYYVQTATFRCLNVQAAGTLAFLGGADTAIDSTHPFTSGATFGLPLQVTVEPDADADGFGDETQDLCPTDAGTQAACPAADLCPSEPGTQAACPDRTAPQTTIDGKPKKRTSKRKATFAFSADEAGASFSCGLNGKPFTACVSPARIRAKRGKNTFTVLATDAAGNADATPATFGWTVR